MVKDGEVVIVDEFTGRLMPGRRWSDGLHQAVEAKEGVKIENENQTLATISFQNYFRMYSKLAGMTGTADTEAEEFAKIYNLDVVVIPTNKTNVRKDSEDVVYKTEREKFNALCDEIEERNRKGQPILVGTVSVAKSEVVSSLLKRRGVPHNVLNAKHHQREAEIVAQAGRKSAVTISTNMAGRGTDILLGGNPEMMAKHEVGPEPDAPMDGEEQAAFEARHAEWVQRLADTTARLKVQTAAEHDEVTAVGGLHILGTERHESRRIDNQLRGRGGRQGDPGSSIFYLSLEDDLMRIFGSERISRMMETLGMKEGEQIEHRWLTRAIENAQKKVEGHNFDIRKNLLEYDDVMNQQRRSIYRLRRMVLGFGAGVPVVEFDEDPKTKVKTRVEKVWSWSDEREHVLDVIEDLVLDMVGNTCPASASPAKWDLDSLTALVRDQFGLDVKFAGPPAGRGAEARSAIEEQVYNVVEKAYRAKEAELRPRRRRRAGAPPLGAVPLPAGHRPAVEGPPAGHGPPARGHRPARLRPEGPQAGVQEGRLLDVRADDLAREERGHRQPAAAPAGAAGERGQEIEAKRLALARRQRMQESHGGDGDGGAAGAQAGDGGADAPQGRAQRPLPLRLGQEVQEVPRGHRGHGVAAQPLAIRSPRGTSSRSARSNAPWTASASAAAGRAPSSTRAKSSSRMPVKMG